MNYPNSWLKEYGIEVEATIDGVEERRTGTHVHDGADTNYYSSYSYVADDGTTYRGSRGRYDSKQEAESHNARLLEEKENIRILIYKNKFGIDEVWN